MKQPENWLKKKHDVVIIDPNHEKLHKMSEHLDISTVAGSAIDFEVLSKAGIDKAELFIACSNADETNMVICYFAAKLSNCRKVARIRSISLRNFPEATFKEFGIDLTFNPEGLAVNDLMNIFNSPGAFEAIKVFGGNIFIKGYTIKHGSPCTGKHIAMLTRQYSFLDRALFVSILREDAIIFPNADTTLYEGDKVHILAMDEVSEEITSLFSGVRKRGKNIFIAGANNLTDNLLIRLEYEKLQIKLFENDKLLCQEIAEKFPKIKVINGNPANEELLVREGLSHCDCFIGCCKDEELSIISCLIAKRYSIPVIALNSDNSDFFPFILSTGIDTIISPHMSAVSTILRSTRDGIIHKTLPIVFGKAELIRIMMNDKSKLIGKKLREIKIPETSIISLIIRGKGSIIPKGNTAIEENDIIFFLTAPENIKKIERLSK
jgi:trk system potassium uptake protein TrkA